MRETTSLPEWMRSEENYTPERDRAGFLSKSILQVMSLLSRIRANGGVGEMGAGAPLKIFCTVFFIVLAVCSRNGFFLGFLLAGLLVRLCFLHGKELARVFLTALGTAFFSAILMFPAVFLGSPRALLVIPCKVFFSVGMVQLMAATTPWNRITEGLRFFHVPNLFLFTLDITLKYIAILGEICLHMLEALKLRSIGRNRDSGRSLGGVSGVAFLKSQEMSEEMYGAMVCRCFDGTYQTGKTGRDSRRIRLVLKRDGWCISLMIVVTALFICLERTVT